MGLRKLPNGKWEVNVVHNGRRIRRRFYDRQRAQGVLDSINAIRDTNQEEDVYKVVADIMGDTN